MTRPLLTTRTRDVPWSVVVEIATVPPGMLYRSALSSRLAMSRSSSTRVAGDRGLVECGGRRDVVGGASLECVPGDVGEIQWVVEDARLIVAREHQEDFDEPFGVIDGLPDVGGHANELGVCRRGLGEDDVDRGAHDR